MRTLLRSANVLPSLIFFFIAGCGPASPPTAKTQHALANGTPETAGDPAVVDIQVNVSSCTATLIGRRTFLTAAHCLADNEAAFVHLFPCGNAYNCAPRYFNGLGHRHPLYSGYDDSDHDVGVVVLNEDVTSATGIVPRRIGGSPKQGGLLYLVGYGRTNCDDDKTWGQKSQGTNVISDVFDETIEFDDTSRTYTCPGDSGGPAFDGYSDCVMAVTSGVATSLFDTDYIDSRVDTKRDWIQQVASAGGDSTVYGCGQSVCGDGICQWPDTCLSCPGDCGVCPTCGDQICNGSETCASCPGDCGACPDECGDGVCSGAETADSCPQDCAPATCPRGTADCCGDGTCMTPTICRKVGCTPLS